MSFRLLEFQRLEFRDGLNLTVRDGTKWADRVKTGDTMGIRQTGTDEVTHIGTVKTVALRDFDTITENALQTEHSPASRTHEGLKTAMNDAYGIGKWGPFVTLLFFTIQPV